MARTFVPVSDAGLIRAGETAAVMSVQASTDHGIPYYARVEVRQGVRKRIKTTFGDGLSPKEIIGYLPLVALSPDHKAITFGGPADRRSFIDALMAQSSRSVTELLFEHRRLLQQRNACLGNGIPAENNVLSAVTSAFVVASAQLIERRSDFIAQLAPLVREEYENVVGEFEDVQIEYRADSVRLDGEQSLEKQLFDIAHQLESAEIRRGTTLFGPQKDEVLFLLNGRAVRDSASQGQHKSLLVALKLAEARLVHQHTNERPVVLLDDVFSELDSRRADRVLRRILEMNVQCFISTTDGRMLAQQIANLDGITSSDIRYVTVPDDVVTDGADSKERVAA